MTRFLIVGLGSIGRRHLRNLLALGQRDIVLCRSGKSNLPADELSSFPTETDLKTALIRYHPQAVIVSNPTALHLPVALEAAKAGCHLLIEKPVSHQMEGIDELQNIVEKEGVQVLVGYQFRFHPSLRYIRQILGEGSIGRPLWARAHWGEYLPDWHPWEDYRLGYSARKDLGGGVLLTLCHPFDYLLWLFGKPLGVLAYKGTLGELNIDVEDLAEVILQYNLPFVASVHLDYLQRPPSHSLSIGGTHGSIEWNYASGEVRIYRLDNQSSGKPSQPQIFSLPHAFERNEMFLAEMRHFLDVIEGKCAPICTLEEGIASLQIVLAAHQAAHEGRQVILSNAFTPS